MNGWTGVGRVRAREDSGALVVAVEGLTTQAKYYKPLIHEFFRKEWRGSRPAWGDFEVDILMEYTGDPPWMDLDNLAKAILECCQGLRLPRRRSGLAASGGAAGRRAGADHHHHQTALAFALRS